MQLVEGGNGNHNQLAIKCYCKITLVKHNYLISVDEALLQKEREKVKLEYETELCALREQFDEMHSSKRLVQEEFDTLKLKFDQQIKNINEKVHLIF